MSMRKTLFVAASLLVAASCAKQQEPINRVQPDYLDKEFLVGKDYLNANDDPEFYSRGTLIDVGYGAGQDGLFTSTYAQPLTRVKWTIQENLLVARLSYERIADSDGKGVAGKSTNDGIVVAAYTISKHFDIKRDYNPATGEQLNIIEENDTDRPWYERQYIRVDWSKNLSVDDYDYDMLSQMGVFGGVTYEPLAYYINDPKSPDAPHIDAAAGYLDITNKAFAKPGVIDLSRFGGGTFPACFFDSAIAGGGAPTTQCSPVELTIRQSFLKVPASDYEPEDYDGQRFSAFGAFTTDRNGYARNYGMTDAQLHHFIERYDIWQRSHYFTDAANMTGAVECFTPTTTPAGADPHRDDNHDGTEDECANIGRGSRCDTFSQKCTLPFRDRTPTTIAWYFAEGSNQAYFEPSKKAAHEWDVALRASVLAARYVECAKTNDANCAAQFPMYSGMQDDNQDAIDLATEVDSCREGIAYQGQDCNAVADQVGADRGYSAGVIAVAKMAPMIAFCHAPVEANDPAACGTPRLPSSMTAAKCNDAIVSGDEATLTTCAGAVTARRGDIRYHEINAITAPQTPSPWGIMVDAHDPLTGKTVAASINVWSHVTDLWSQSVVDTARYIKGELATSDVTDGTYVRDWANAAQAASGQGATPHLDDNARYEFLASLLGADSAAQLLQSKQALKDSPVMKQAYKLRQQLQDIKADARALSTTAPIYEARRRKALDTPTEAALTTKMMQSYAGGSGLLDPATMTQLASPLRGASPDYQRNINTARELAWANRGGCMMQDDEAPAPLAIANLADVLEAKFGHFDHSSAKGDQLSRAEKMRQYLANRAHYAVITHEMGHSIGLRHNFVSSADAFNYRPQYWQLRTSNGMQTTPCSGTAPSGTDCVGPRYLDPVTPEEQQNLISMFMQSSTMDYAGEATQDTLGLGAYDFAAAQMFYGDVAAVFKDDDLKAGTPLGVGALGKLDSFGGILGIKFAVGNGDPSDPTATTDIHYSALQASYKMINDCAAVDVAKFKPAAWNSERDGEWSPLFDGLIVSVGGQTSRCHQRQVDHVSWNALRDATPTEVGFTQSTHAIDPNGRVRFPYGFATDHWADLGNLSVYRHDNGADPYELFDFLITTQEVNHIFDNYRRGRTTFSVRAAADRSLNRYNTKLRDAAKGLGLMANIYRDFAQSQGYDYNGLWPVIGAEFFADNLLASGLGFDHFAKQLARPAAGPHSVVTRGSTSVLVSNLDTAGNAGQSVVTIPNGATGYFGNVEPGGRPLENALASNMGDYNTEFTINAGSYYDKAWTSMLMTESVDNFISESRRDFVDGRYRAVSLADVFPDGYRRWLGNNLTGDAQAKGPRLQTDSAGMPMTDMDGYPANNIGYMEWFRKSPGFCFPRAMALTCDMAPNTTVAVDPEVGWEQQKFLIAWTLQYLPENNQQWWLNQLDIWEQGADTDPGFANRIELHLPDGRVYIAQTQGHEYVGTEYVQKGIAARMLEWGNQLVQQAFETTPGPDNDLDGQPDWYVPVMKSGAPVVKYDPTVSWITPQGFLQQGRPGCDANSDTSCTCTSNNACMDLAKFEELPFFMRQAMRDYGLADPSMRGLY